MEIDVSKYEYENYQRKYNSGISFKVKEGDKCIAYISHNLTTITFVKDGERWNSKNSKKLHLSKEQKEFFKLLGA